MCRSGSGSIVNVTANEPSRESMQEAVIVEVEVPPAQVVLMQSLAQGEEGMATVRCMDSEGRRQQFWTTAAQLETLHEWIGSLPAKLDVKVTGQWRWQQEEKHGE